MQQDNLIQYEERLEKSLKCNDKTETLKPINNII